MNIICNNIHQNIFVTLLIGSKAKSVLAKQLCCIQTKKKKKKKKKKMNRIYRKNNTTNLYIFYII